MSADDIFGLDTNGHIASDKLETIARKQEKCWLAAMFFFLFFSRNDFKILLSQGLLTLYHTRQFWALPIQQQIKICNKY